jgi:predicted DNA-binding protein
MVNENIKSFTLRVPDNLSQKMAKHQSKYATTKNEFIRLAISNFIDKIEREGE